MGRMFRWMGLLAITIGGCAIGFDEYQAVCEPGTEQPCYSGPDGTEGVGVCKAGVHNCKPDGSGYGTCAGEVTPITEDCSTNTDEDCDGEIPDAECMCKPGVEEACYSGPAGTKGVGACKAGVRTCKEDGSSYGACAGETVPQIELCETLTVDESCDGEPMCTGAHLLSKGFGVANDQFGLSTVVDGAGNIVLTGYFEGSVDFGDGPLNSAGGYDIFVAKFDSQLTHRTSKHFGDAAQQTGYSIAVDGADNIVLSGYFSGTVDFGGGPLASAGANDIFVAKFDKDLTYLQSRRFGGTDEQRAYGIAVDGDGNVVLTGIFKGSVNFDKKPAEELTSAGDYDIFVAKLDENLNHVASKRFGALDSQECYGLAIDGSGNVLLTGSFEGSFDFGADVLTSMDDYDNFVAKLNSELQPVRSKSFGGTKSQYGNSIAVDGAGNVVLLGHFDGSVDFDGQVLASAFSSYDLFVAKLDPQLNHLWSERFGDVGNQFGYKVAIDGTNNVVLTGAFDGLIKFDEKSSLASAGQYDVLVAKLDPQLNHLWSERFGDATGQYGNSIAVDASGNVVLTGAFQGSVHFGGDSLTSAGGYDIFVAKLAP